MILERLAAEEGIDRVVESYPRLDGESVGGALLFAAGRVEEMLARLGLPEEPLVDAVLDEHSEEDERMEVPPRRYFRDEAEPPALLAVSEKVLAADVSEERAMQAMRELKGSDVQFLLEAEAARTEEAGLEWRRPSWGALPESRGPSRSPARFSAYSARKPAADA